MGYTPVTEITILDILLPALLHIQVDLVLKDHQADQAVEQLTPIRAVLAEAFLGKDSQEAIAQEAHHTAAVVVVELAAQAVSVAEILQVQVAQVLLTVLLEYQ